MMTGRDIEWLGNEFPSLIFDSSKDRIMGELDFSACYDRAANKLVMGRDDAIRVSDTFLSDVFEIAIHLDSRSIAANGWPTVYEVGGRRMQIAKKHEIQLLADLHFFSEGACCLGIRYFPEKKLSLKIFVYERVIPFFYRLSYTDRYGLDRARRDLWPEYSHGLKGQLEYEREMRHIAQRYCGRNAQCPCGSGKKSKHCCLDEAFRLAGRC